MGKFEQKNKNVDWAKVRWTPAQVRASKRTAKAAAKADTAEVVSDYVAEKAVKGEKIRKGAAMRIWAKEKLHKGKHLSKADKALLAKKTWASKKKNAKNASTSLKVVIDKEMKRSIKFAAEQVALQRGGKKTTTRMLKAMKERVKKFEQKNKNVDWAKVRWTPAQVRASKRTAKAAAKADTAEVVSDYVAEKAVKGEKIRKGAAMRIWAKEKLHKGKHLSKADKALLAKKTKTS